MEAYRGESYESAMRIPIPVRKWLIQRWNKRRDEENKDSKSDDTSKPLNPAQRMAMIRQQNKVNPQNQSENMSPSSFLSGMRNKG